MKSDIDIKRDVEEELRLNPDLDATDIAVAVKSGVVTLSGFVRSYSQRWEAERTVKRVNGVTGVANDIEVRLPVFNQRPDPEIARDAVSAVQSELPYSSEHIRVIARDGWLTLEGQVEWNYARERAERAVRRVRGVKGVTNLIQVSPRVPPVEVRRKIEKSFRRSAEVDAESHNRRNRWRRRDATRLRSILGRAPGGRAGRLAGARRLARRKPDHHQSMTQ